MTPTRSQDDLPGRGGAQGHGLTGGKAEVTQDTGRKDGDGAVAVSAQDDLHERGLRDGQKGRHSVAAERQNVKHC